MDYELTLERKNQLWDEFNEWHRQRYGWTLREDIKGQREYEGAQAWFAWLEKARRDEQEMERLSIELRDTLAPDDDSPTPNASLSGAPLAARPLDCRVGRQNGNYGVKTMNEQLTKARDCAQFAADDLRAALTGADSVEALVLLPMIGDAARLVQQIEALIFARADRG